MQFKQNDMVKTCKYLERGLTFMPWGIHSCVMNTIQSPPLFTREEINSGQVTYERIVKKRIELFEAINANNKEIAGNCIGCTEIYQCAFKDVNFNDIGGTIMCIQHYSACNLRCQYCDFTIRNDFVPPQYSIASMVEIINSFRATGKIHNDSWVNFSGGEPSILKDFEDGLMALQKTGLGHICVFSNAVKFSDAIHEHLSKNEITLTTSFDAGLPSTYKEIRGANALMSVIDNIIRYKKSGTDNLWLKFIITEKNCNEDDLLSFVFLMTAIKPDCVYIVPQFPYGDAEIPEKFVTFGAKMWYLLKKYGDLKIHIQTDDNHADPKFKKFSDAIRVEFDKLTEEAPLTDTYNLNPIVNVVNVQIMKEAAKRGAEAVKLAEAKMWYLLKKCGDLRIHIQTAVLRQFKELYRSLFLPPGRQAYAIRKSGLFDIPWYLEQNPDVAATNINPILHYVRYGAAEGRDPAPWFSTSNYRALNPDVDRSRMNIFYHYIVYGAKEGRQLS